MTHTPLPWRLSLTDDTLVVADLPDGQRRVVQSIGAYSTEFIEMEANAAFIVKAVNNHAALVELLTLINDDFNRYMPAHISEKIRAALKAVQS